MTMIAWLALWLGGCATAPPASEGTATSFPDAWIGVWQGTLEWQQRSAAGPDTPPRTIGFTLEIGPRGTDGSRPWRLSYEGQSTREYRLREVDVAAGQFAIDEGDGLVLTATWFGDTLVSRFAVAGSLLCARQRFLADRIEHEIWAGPIDGSRLGGGVDAHRVTTLQRAVLRRS